MYYIGYITKNLDKMMVFKADTTPTKDQYRYLEKVVGPFGTKEEAMYEMRGLRRRIMANPKRAKYCRERQLSPSMFDPQSFRTIPLGKSGKKGVIGCPKRHFHRGKCGVGTRLQTILHPEGSGRCPVGAGGRELKKRNPMTRTGLYYPRAGSQEAYEWAERMHRIKKRKRNPVQSNPAKVISHRQALALTKKIVSYAKKLFRHELAGVRSENPGADYHYRKFTHYMNELNKHVLGSREYITTLAKAYEHMKSAEESQRG